MAERNFLVNERLRKLIQWHNLRRQDVCRMLKLRVHKRSLSNGTLDDWLSDRSPMKERDLLCLNLMLQEEAKELKGK